MKPAEQAFPLVFFFFLRFLLLERAEIDEKEKKPSRPDILAVKKRRRHKTSVETLATQATSNAQFLVNSTTCNFRNRAVFNRVSPDQNQRNYSSHRCNSTTNQSELKANTCNSHQARENTCERVMIGFVSHWLRKWRGFFLANHGAQLSKTKANTNYYRHSVENHSKPKAI